MIPRHNGSLNPKMYAMKKIVTAVIFFYAAQFASAQENIRAYTNAEINRQITFCTSFSKSIPAVYGSNLVKKTACASFDWAVKDNQGRPLTAFDARGNAIGNLPTYSIEFSKDPDSVEAASNRVLAEIVSAQKPGGGYDQKKIDIISARNERINQCAHLIVAVQTNVYNEITEAYPVNAKPEPLAVPVKATALFYRFPAGMPILDENGTDESGTSIKRMYSDRAVIFISDVPPRIEKTAPVGSSNYREDKITPVDKPAQLLNTPVKNILVTISGEEADVKAVIRQIDWKQIAGNLGK